MQNKIWHEVDLQTVQWIVRNQKAWPMQPWKLAATKLVRDIFHVSLKQAFELVKFFEYEV